MVILHHNSNTETDSRINSILQKQLKKIYLTVEVHKASECTQSHICHFKTPYQDRDTIKTIYLILSNATSLTDSE